MATRRMDETANDRFKRTSRNLFWASLMVATFFHFAVLRFFPKLAAADVSFSVTELEAVELPPEVEIPPPPEAIERPALPVVAEADLDEDITIAPTTFSENPVELLPPPPNRTARPDHGPTATPYTVAPRLKDPRRAARIVEQKFPLALQKAGIGGTVMVWAFIDQTGIVQRVQMKTSSGNSMLDGAALAAVQQFEFTPALNLDERVPVWVGIPITFRIDD